MPRAAAFFGQMYSVQDEPAVAPSCRRSRNHLVIITFVPFSIVIDSVPFRPRMERILALEGEQASVYRPIREPMQTLDGSRGSQPRADMLFGSAEKMGDFVLVSEQGIVTGRERCQKVSTNYPVA